ncbi:WD40 repeat domain-containing protein, partial [Nonomuraea sp. NPDC004297]
LAFLLNLGGGTRGDGMRGVWGSAFYRVVLLSVAAGRLSPTDEARSSLFASVADPADAVFHDPDTGPDVVRALTPDGRSLVSVSPKEVRIWDVDTGRRTGGFTGLPGRQLRQAAVSADGRLLAIADSAGIGVRDLATGRAVGRRVPAPEELEVSVAFGGGLLLLVTIGDSRSVVDWRTGRETALLTDTSPFVHPGSGYAVHPGGGHAVAGQAIWALPSGARRTGFPGVCAACPSFPAFNRDGTRLAVSDDAGLTVYDTRTRKELVALSDWEVGARPVFSPDGDLIAGVGERVTVWRPDADEPLLLEREPADRAGGVAFGPGGLRYLSEDAVVTLKPNPPSGEPMDTVRLSGDGRLVATHTLDSTKVTLNGAEHEAGSFNAYDAEFAFSPDGRALAIRNSDDVSVRDIATWRELARLTPGFAITSEADTAMPTPKGLWTAGEKTFTLWSLPGGRRLKDVPRPRLLGWATDASGRLVGLDADRMRVVDLETGEPAGDRLSLPALAQNVWFSPDLKLVAVDFSGKVGVWDTATGARVGDWLRTGGAAWDGVFSADGRLFAFASQDKTLSLWDVARGRPIGSAVRLADSARSVVFTAGSAELLAIGRGGRPTR